MCIINFVNDNGAFFTILVALFGAFLAFIYMRRQAKIMNTQNSISIRQALLGEQAFKINLLHMSIGILEKQKDLPDDEAKEHTIKTTLANNKVLEAEIKEIDSKLKKWQLPNV